MHFISCVFYKGNACSFLSQIKSGLWKKLLCLFEKEIFVTQDIIRFRRISAVNSLNNQEKVINTRHQNLELNVY